jgi:hypothetical protein
LVIRRIKINVDGREYVSSKFDFILTEYHKVEVLKVTTARLIHFNRAFYCIADHDSEVGCKGFCFWRFSIPKNNNTK